VQKWNLQAEKVIMLHKDGDLDKISNIKLDLQLSESQRKEHKQNHPPEAADTKATAAAMPAIKVPATVAIKVPTATIKVNAINSKAIAKPL